MEGREGERERERARGVGKLPMAAIVHFYRYRLHLRM